MNYVDFLTLASIGISSTFISHANGPKPNMKKKTNTISPTKGTQPISDTVPFETTNDDAIIEPFDMVGKGFREEGWHSGQLSYILKNIPTATIEIQTNKSESTSNGFLPNFSTIKVWTRLATI